jgi:uncharacterized protein (DUF983 family)
MLARAPAMPVSLSLIVQRGLRGRCPNCGGPLIFGRGWRLLNQCPAPDCGLRWQRSDGFHLGAFVVDYAIAVFVGLPLLVLAAARGWLSTRVATAAAFGVALLFPPLFYKASWSLWLMIYYFVLPHELPANTTDRIPARADE